MSSVLAHPISTAGLIPPDRPGAWLDRGYEPLFEISWRDYEEVQLQVLKRRYQHMSGSVVALERLAKRQNVRSVDTVQDVLPLLFDHRVYKSYPLSLIENRDYPSSLPGSIA